MWMFENRHSHLCIHHAYWDSVPGRYLLQHGCKTNTYARDWYAYRWDGGLYFQSYASGLFMAVAGASKEQGASLVQWHYEQAPHFRFRFVYAGRT
jgi:hypothetical protein